MKRWDASHYILLKDMGNGVTEVTPSFENAEFSIFVLHPTAIVTGELFTAPIIAAATTAAILWFS